MKKDKKSSVKFVKNIKYALHGQYEGIKEYESKLLARIENKDFDSVVDYVNEMTALLSELYVFNNKGFAKLSQKNSAKELLNDSEESSSQNQCLSQIKGQEMSRSLCHVVYDVMDREQFDWLRAQVDKRVQQDYQKSFEQTSSLFEVVTPIICDRIVDDIVIDKSNLQVLTNLNQTEISTTMYLASLRAAQATQFGSQEQIDTYEKDAYLSAVKIIKENYQVESPQISLAEMLYPSLPSSPNLSFEGAQCQE